MTPLEAGLATLPAAAVMIAITPFITPLAVKIGSRAAVLVGFGVAAAGFAALAFVGVSWAYVAFVLPLIAISADSDCPTAQRGRRRPPPCRPTRSERHRASPTWLGTSVAPSRWR